MEELLFLSHRIPYPPNKGDKIRSWHILRHLSERYRVHLAAFIDDPDDWQHTQTVRERCEEAFFAPLDRTRGKLRSFPALLRGGPLTLAFFQDAGLERWVRDLLARRRPKRVFVCCSSMAPYAMELPYPGARRVIDFIDVDSEKWRQYAEHRPWPFRAVFRREARTLGALEREVAARFDASIFAAAREARLFRRMAPESADRVFHVDNGVDSSYFSPLRVYERPFARDHLPIVFTGMMDYWPNIDAVSWFAHEILPGVRGHGLPVRFYIVGANPSAEVRALERLPGVTVTGRVADVRPYLAHAAAVVAPLRVARGVQNKVLEAMAMGKAVIATPDALEGIDALAGQHLHVADTPETLADAVSGALLNDDNETMGRRARDRVVELYSWEGSLARLEAILEGDLTSSRPRIAPALPAVG